MNRRLFAIVFVVFTNLIGAGVVVPTLPLYAEGRFGATAIDAAYFIAIYHVAQFFAAPALGHLSDRIGRRPVLIGSQLGTILSFLMFIYAGQIGSVMTQHHLGIFSSAIFILYFARMLDGMTGGNITAAQAYITDVTPPHDRVQALGYIQTSFGLGLVFGPAFGGVLANISIQAPFWGAIALTSISLLLTVLILPESISDKTPASPSVQSPPLYAGWQEFLSNYTILLLLALSFVVNFTVTGLSAIFPLFAARIAYPHISDDALVARNVGYMLAYLGTAAVLTQLFLLRPLVRRFGEQNVILLSIISTSLTALGLMTLSNSWWLTLALTPAAFAYATGIPSGQALLVRFGNDRSNGQLMGLSNATNSLANVVGPLMGGYIFVEYGPRAPFFVTGVMIAGTIALALVLKARTIPQVYSVRS